MTKVLTINAGSASLKASLFNEQGARRDFHYRLGVDPKNSTVGAVLPALFNDLGEDLPDAIGHRFVHGGEIKDLARLLNEEEIARLEGVTSLAPLHMPVSLSAVRALMGQFHVPQVACFDTGFHRTLPELSWRLPIPEKFGMRRYGFHGLNYAYIAQRLPEVLGELATGKIIVAHLGGGASLCLLENLQSVDTTMGFTPAGGVSMATRSGDLDPGVMLELAKHRSIQELSEIVYRQMGLLALSKGESSDMAVLLASTTADAAFAVDFFCRQIQAQIGALAAKAGGVDALVFTGGIGFHCPEVREKIAFKLGFLGVELDRAANTNNQLKLHRPGSLPMLMMAADEESTIRTLTLNCLI